VRGLIVRAGCSSIIFSAITLWHLPSRISYYVRNRAECASGSKIEENDTMPGWYNAFRGTAPGVLSHTLSF